MKKEGVLIAIILMLVFTLLAFYISIMGEVPQKPKLPITCSMDAEQSEINLPLADFKGMDLKMQ